MSTSNHKRLLCILIATVLLICTFGCAKESETTDTTSTQSTASADISYTSNESDDISTESAESSAEESQTTENVEALKEAFSLPINYKIDYVSTYVSSEGTEEYAETYYYLAKSTDASEPHYDIRYDYTYDNENFTDYIVYDETDGLSWYVYFDDETQKWYKCSEESFDYYFLNESSSFYPEGLNAEDFVVAENSTYVPAEDKLQIAARAIFGDYNDAESGTTDIYEYLKITLENGKIKTIEVASDYTDEDGTAKISYVLTFSEYGEVSFDIPEAEISEDSDIDWEDSGSASGTSIFLPSAGTRKVLVVPVNFTDHTISEEELKKLEIALNGDADSLEWESVKSYYSESSYGKLDLCFEIAPAFNTGNNAKFYEDIYFSEDAYAEDTILQQIFNAYDEKYDFSQYDSNQDGYVDSVMLIYAAPIDYESDDTLWWSWSSYYEDDSEEWDQTSIGMYVWAGIDSLNEEIAPGVSVDINTTTLIHETGHLLGLEDYYDAYVDAGPTGGLGGGDMMDCAVGDHCSASKILLGWSAPTVINGTETTVTIDSFSESGNAILLGHNWNGSYYDEYLLIESYTPTGLNEFHAGLCGLPDISGIRIFHVDARIDAELGDPYNEIYPTYYSFNNSTSEHKFIKLIEADGNNDIESTEMYADGNYSENDDLFQKGDTFGNGYKWYDGTELGFEITVNSYNNTTGKAKITVSYK